MTNNLEDFEQPDAGQGGELPPVTGTRAKLLHAWRTRPLFKLVVLMVVVGAVIAVSMTMFSSPAPVSTSHIVTPPSMKEAPGGPASPYFLDQQKKADEDRVKNALATNGSAIPTPIGQNAGVDETLGNEKLKKDPLIELKGEIEHQNQQLAQMKQQQLQQIQQQQQQPVAAPPKPPEQFDNSLAQAMQAQLKSLMTSWEPHAMRGVTVSPKDREDKKSGNGLGTNSDNTPTSILPSAPPKVLVPAGTVSYAQMLTEANSDVKGPILAQILSGPLAGARAIGRFEVMNEYLVMRFNLANLKNVDYRIDTLALDPDTTLGGLATEVDERYITRVLLPAAAAFMQGLGSALGQNNSSVVTNGTSTIVSQSGVGIQQGMFEGLSESAKTVGQFFQNQANETQPLIRVAAGTPMGLFFLSTLYDQSNAAYGAGAPYPNYPGYNGYNTGYGGYPPSGYGAYGSGYGYNGMPGGYYPGMTQTGYNSPSASYTGSQPGYSGSNGAYQSGNTGPYPSASSPYSSTNSTASSTPYGNNGNLNGGTNSFSSPVVNP